jgi:SAM-dependent methyltransferase
LISFTDYSESLTDSVLNFPEEFGRTYHAYRAGSYVFPNDMPERERLQLQSDIILKTFGGNLFFAPIQNTSPRRILDIATGTGEWAIQMGDRFPQAQVIATDLSPIQPGEVPPNVNFYVEDSSEPWEYSHNFDFIHTRVTAGCWESFKLEVADQAFANLDPGGWFESHEYDADFSCDDDTLNPNGALMGWSHNMITAGTVVGRSLRIARYLKRDYEAAGFVDVQERIFKIPTNAWAKEERLKELGRMWEWNYSRGISAFSYGLFNRAFDLTREQIELDLVEVRKELSDPKIHAYVCLHAVWGRKPFPGEGATVQPKIQTE